MNKSLIKGIFWLAIIQVIVYIFGFSNWAADTSGWKPLLNIYSSGFGTIMYWSVLGCLSVVITVLSIYVLSTKSVGKGEGLGIILSIIGSLLPLVLMFFLIIPATVLILAVFFINYLNFRTAKPAKAAAKTTKTTTKSTAAKAKTTKAASKATK
ncbi:hypothetical protein Q2T76_01180 [Lactobacillus sp. YT155]|uniref:hypothetical protein n=1 Tax=Lactobacillus sp. YT155 TaxID=3060955 RepID=UPI0026604B8A|nr:hypothetical protein [Lactobacillus sp. YT155]MDO1604663.1 hypothetical protein [Lactobacillus sp. YT155]